MNTTNHWYKDVTVSLKRGEVDIKIGQPKQTVIQPTKPPVPPSEPWKADEIGFVVVVCLTVVALGIIIYRKFYRPIRIQ